MKHGTYTTWCRRFGVLALFGVIVLGFGWSTMSEYRKARARVLSKAAFDRYAPVSTIKRYKKLRTVCTESSVTGGLVDVEELVYDERKMLTSGQNEAKIKARFRNAQVTQYNAHGERIRYLEASEPLYFGVHAVCRVPILWGVMYSPSLVLKRR